MGCGTSTVAPENTPVDAPSSLAGENDSTTAALSPTSEGPLAPSAAASTLTDQTKDVVENTSTGIDEGVLTPTPTPAASVTDGGATEEEIVDADADVKEAGATEESESADAGGKEEEEETHVQPKYPKPTTTEPEPENAAPAAPPSVVWHKAELPNVVCTREELRQMSKEGQERYAKAVWKMRQNDVDADGNDIKGSSQYFRLASYHGGFEQMDAYPKYCVHGHEAFPGWHRAYLLDFERTMRKADVALGGDGNIALPYWDWTVTEIEGQIYPKILSTALGKDAPDGLMTEFNVGFYPDGAVSKEDVERLGQQPGTPYRGQFLKLSDQKSEEEFAATLQSATPSMGELIGSTLLSTSHRHHASTFTMGRRGIPPANEFGLPRRRPDEVSIETPHNNIHVYVSGIMRTMVSSFHPIFWLHHCNVDRFYEKYISLEPDSKEEYKQFQDVVGEFILPQVGYPDGVFGTMAPFNNHVTAKPFHTDDTFDCMKIGFTYDALPETPATAFQMREPPYYAVFRDVDVNKMEGQTRVLFVFVSNAAAEEPPSLAWSPPIDTSRKAITEHAGYAGSGAIFFLAIPGGCENCETRPPQDILVDVTAALRKNNIHPRSAKLHVMVENEDGTIVPVADTPVPAPVLQGPTFASMDEPLDLDGEGEDNDAGEVKQLQRILVAGGWLSAADIAQDGAFSQQTFAAVKAAQNAAGLKVDGIAGPKTKRALLTFSLGNDVNLDDAIALSKVDNVRWTLNLKSVPAYMPNELVINELTIAFNAWAGAAGKDFDYVAEGDVAVAKDDTTLVRVDFDDRSHANEFIFDGEGGALAHASAAGITFDASERWELQGRPHHRANDHVSRGAAFQLLPVAIHEVGHVLGLGHSRDPADVMAPFYIPGKITLSENDKAMVAALAAAVIKVPAPAAAEPAAVEPASGPPLSEPAVAESTVAAPAVAETAPPVKEDASTA